METFQVTLHLPIQIKPIIADQMRKEGYASINAFGTSIFLYQCAVDRPHQVITERDFREKRIGAIADEIVASYGKKPLTGSWLECRLDELADERAKGKSPKKE